MSLSRRNFLAVLGAAAFVSEPLAALPKFKSEAVPFSRDWLKAEAKRISQEPYKPMPKVPEAWRKLTYDQYKALSFNTKKALWSDTDRAFQMDFFAPGLYFPRPVEINIVEDGKSRTLAFDLSLFKRHKQFPQELIKDEPEPSLGYSGLRLRYELQKPGKFEEFMVFQGASYFRAIGTTQNYGLSARGLALNTGEESGEEFPEFSRFWVEAPGENTRSIVVHALLDSPSVSGAYTFTITPGLPVTIKVEAELFPRKDLSHVGLAPLTSMFLFDQTNRARFDDFRDAVHDSEGLLIWNGVGETLWRPLANHKDLQVSSFLDESPRGFGLMQRARESEDYADLEAFYHKRPSLWIIPGEDWGKGAISLVEIPSDKEIYDNIVAYWRPSEDMKAGENYPFSYTMEWGEEPVLDTTSEPPAKVTNTRVGKGYDKEKTDIIIAVDLENRPEFAEIIKAKSKDEFLRISTNRGRVSEGIIQRNAGTGGIRVAFHFDPEDHETAELRMQVVKDKEALSEVWLYRWSKT